jgi:hypothetical protein
MLPGGALVDFGADAQRLDLLDLPPTPAGAVRFHNPDMKGVSMDAPEITRAMAARTREAPTVLRIRPMAGLRTPRVLVDIQMPGGAVVVFTLVRRQRGALELRAPQAADGGPGVLLSQREGNRLASIAIEAALADPRALDALKRRTMP